MRSRTIAAIAVLVLFAAAASASPLFGTWKTELNGQTVTVVVSYVDRHVEGKMVVGTGPSARELPMVNARIMDRPPSVLRFEVANQDGTNKLVAAGGENVTFELHYTDGDNATLRVVDETARGAAVKAVKQK